MKKIVLTFGLIAGLVLSLFMIATLPLEGQLGDSAYVVGFAGMIGGFLLIYFGIRSYRDNVAGGSVGFGRAFAIGVLITVIGSVCYTATWEVIYFGGFIPDFAAKYSAHQIDAIKASGGTAEQVAAKKAEMEKFATMYQNPLFNAAMTMLEPLPVGLLIALISAGALSRRRRQLAPS